MTASALMSLGTRAMFASYAQLQTTSHNIANASVEGYSRQTVELKTAQGQFTGAGFFGKGVDVATVSRSHDEFLTREAATTKALAAMDSTRYEQLQRLENIFPTGEQGIGYSAGQFLNAMVDLGSNPQDTSTRQVILSRADELASRFATSASQLDSLQNGVTQDLKTSIGTVNSITAQIADANQAIAKAQGLGQPPNDLLDHRDQLISQLSGFLQVTTIPASDGSVGVFIAGGQRLVLGNEATQLAVSADPMDSSRSGVGIVDSGGTVRALPSAMLTGGSVAGLLRFQSQELADARASLGQMAAAISARVNDQQSLGLDLRTPPGAGAPIFRTGTPVAGPASTNAKDNAGNFIASVSLTVADASLLQASDYDLQADPTTPGHYNLTRLSDGQVTNIVDGATVDGFTVHVGTPAPAASDRFRLQPVSRAANGMQSVLADPQGIAAASPVTATVASTNTGTASVASLRVANHSIDPSLTATITFTSNSGAYNWSLSNGTSGTGTWTAGQPIQLNGFELSLAGVPATGDRMDVGPTTFPASNNGNALALAALRDEPLVGRTSSGGVKIGGDTITDAYATAMASVGVQVQGAKSAAQISGAVAQTAGEQVTSKAGVNLDEEAARLLQYQQSYQAAAKVLQVAQQVFDTLLQTAAG